MKKTLVKLLKYIYDNVIETWSGMAKLGNHLNIHQLREWEINDDAFLQWNTTQLLKRRCLYGKILQNIFLGENQVIEQNNIT